MPFGFGKSKSKLVAAEEALPGRAAPPFAIPERHAVLGTPIRGPFPAGQETAILALGCFWGAERLFWDLPGVSTTAVGYAGGHTPHPTYEEVCSGRTGHAEAVLVAFDPNLTSYEALLKIFFEAHDPTQGMRQGNDVGTQYRSAIYPTTGQQMAIATATRDAYDAALRNSGKGAVTTEIAPAGPFYYAEEYHQQYLHKVPNGYCGLEGTGVSCPIPPRQAAATAATNGATTMTTTDTGGAAAADPKLLPVASHDREWKERLSPEAYKVLRQAGTERPFSGEYVDTDEDGLYRCGACGNPLFASDTKFHSGSGWPSFTEAIDPDAVELHEDRSLFMTRTEVRCARCHSHLGHVFDDGPRDRGGQRFCMNSCALDLDKDAATVGAR